MKKRAQKFKKSPKKYQPKSLNILHEDRDIIVVDKMNGLLTTGSERERYRTAVAYLNEYVRKGVIKSRNRVFAVHRLDRETSGVMVFARHPEAENYLREEWKKFHSSYYAVVNGKMPQSKGEIESYLAESGVHKMYSTKDSNKGKLSKTNYQVIRESSRYSLLRLDPMTARKHQIRVQLADQGCPVAGDKKYGEGEKGTVRLALHAFSLTLTHPYTHKEMTFETEVPNYFEALMGRK